MGEYLFVLIVGMAAGAISGIVGTGSSIMLLPVLVISFGPKQAVPIMAVAAVMANVSRVVAWRREIDWKAFAAYSMTGIPAAAAGAKVLLDLPIRFIDVGLGIFFLAMIPFRHWLAAKNIKIRLSQLALAGGIIGFLTGIVLSTGPLSVPAFTFYGLARGAFLSTEAASSLALYVSKVATFGGLGALSADVIIQGLIVGSSLTVGTFLAKNIVRKMSIGSFRYVLDVLLACSGVSMLWTAFF
ncbi:sulfite exporter TauE/SafE family protein [Paenibacillus sp. S150]|uniref:sulfite exporter TauE/SafE family protein n=1 Tax=Paenibacillus sp. S150 TaxID=2749826 RepID=UPI001C57B1AB|nr:sulfite exporter TauE/SafE family protein [Paenibacillus sp. S150]MBW4084629.1 sulfite exporter TauE/SafE family protein [Paenibacillus sp. S150]